MVVDRSCLPCYTMHGRHVVMECSFQAGQSMATFVFTHVRLVVSKALQGLGMVHAPDLRQAQLKAPQLLLIAQPR